MEEDFQLDGDYFSVNCNKTMRANYYQISTLPQPKRSRKILDISSPESKSNKNTVLLVKQRPIPLHVVMGNYDGLKKPETDISPEIWGCIVPKEFKHRHKPRKVKAEPIAHSVDRSYLLYSKFLKAKPVRVLIRSRSSRKSQGAMSTRAGTMTSRNQVKTSQTARTKIDHKWSNNQEREIVGRYDSEKKPTSSGIWTRIEIKSRIVDYMERGLKAIRNGTILDTTLTN